MEFLNFALDDIQREKLKACVLMGDFNLYLLKYNTHSETNNFLNSMLSNCFHLHILQPTRITDDHSPTLIDNIFMNSIIEYFTISGNMIYDLTDFLSNFLIVKNYNRLPLILKSLSEIILTLMKSHLLNIASW